MGVPCLFFFGTKARKLTAQPIRFDHFDRLSTSPPMHDRTKPASKTKFLLAGIFLLGGAAWELHDGLYSLRTGRTVMVQMHAVTTLESFGISAATAIIAICCLAAAVGWIKPGPQGPFEFCGCRRA